MDATDWLGAPVRRLLAVKLSSFGDIVHATPCLRALRAAFPAADIRVAVERRWRDVLACDPHIDGLVELAYAQSADAVARLLSIGGPDAVVGLLRDLSAGTELTRAFEPRFGMRYDDFEQALIR